MADLADRDQEQSDQEVGDMATQAELGTQFITSIINKELNETAKFKGLFQRLFEIVVPPNRISMECEELLFATLCER